MMNVRKILDTTDRPWRMHALQHDLELLVIRPASTSAGFNNP